MPRTARATVKRLSHPSRLAQPGLESLMPGERVVVAGFEPMSEITVVLDREVATQLVKRIKHSFHVNVGSEAAFQKLLAALDTALQTA